MRRKVLALFTSMLLWVPVLGFVGCAEESGEDEAGPKAESDGKELAGKEDAWNYSNNPARFNIQFEYKLELLPTEGAAENTPWPDTYWPTYEDSTNVRWQGKAVLSPMEKFDKAFNGWEPAGGWEEFMKLRPFDSNKCGQADSWDKAYYEKLGPAALYQTREKGMHRMVNGRDDDGDGKTDECPVHGDQENDDYDGVQTWWGLCHAWVPAAVLEPEPQHAVTYNGVTFDVGDIKGLLQTVYDRSSALMLGGRCNERVEKLELDENGRVKLDHCRDTNAGAFHVVTANMLGRYKRSFAEDKTFDYQVWNQPVRRFKVLALEKDLTAEQAMQRLRDNGVEYRYNAAAKKFAYVKTTFDYITESNATNRPLVGEIDTYTRSDTYEYILELDADGKILGGEWLDYNQKSHPDFLWLPISVGSGANPYVPVEKVKMLAELSRKSEEEANDPNTVIKTFDSDASYASDANVWLPIADNAPDAFISKVITVGDELEIGTLKVKVNIEHTYIGDLKVKLVHDGQEVVLHDQQGGGADNLVQTFDVHQFDGTRAKGNWELRVSDHAAQDTGKLRGWSLVVSTIAADVSPVAVKTASYNVKKNIPDNRASGITTRVTVADEGTIEKAELALKITHPYIGDLVVSIEHNGASQVLHNREGGSADNIVKTYSLTGFSGSVKGDWVVKVADKARGDRGSLDSWTMTATVR